MPFKEQFKQWVKRAVGDGDENAAYCQSPIYTEEQGFVDCGSHHKLQVHHIPAEGWALAYGLDPEYECAPIVLCDEHHVGRGDDVDNEIYSKFHSMHPDIGAAHDSYRDWKVTCQRLYIAVGPEAAGAIPSPYEEAAQGHRQMEAEGIKYWDCPDEVDQFLVERQKEILWQYQITHPEDPPPNTRAGHPHTDRSKAEQAWYMPFFTEGEE